MKQWYQCPNCGSAVALGARFCANCGMGLGLPNQQQMQQQPSYERRRVDRKFSIIGIVFAVLSLGLFPIFLGSLAVAFGVIGIVKNDTILGVLAIVLGVFFGFIGVLWGTAVWSHLLGWGMTTPLFCLSWSA